MGDIVNLRQARKVRDRAEAKDSAAVNRLTHGVGKTAKTLAKVERDAVIRTLDGAKRDRPEDR